MLFMYLGWLYQRIRPVFMKQDLEFRIAIYLLLCAIWVWCIINFKAFWLVHGTMSHEMVDVVGSIGGCAVLIFLSKLIVRYTYFLSNYFVFLGQNSIVVLCIHKLENTFLKYSGFISRLAKSIAGLSISRSGIIVGAFICKMLLITIFCFLIVKTKRLRKLFGLN